jgi:hypothetical protein
VRALLARYKKKHTTKPSRGLAHWTYLLDFWALAYENRHKFTFLKGHLLRRNINKIIFKEYIFFKILIVKVLFSNLPSKKGMSFVTYRVRERVKEDRLSRLFVIFPMKF